jgi:glutamyl-tRNA(Gln) amidotransferase subunit E
VPERLDYSAIRFRCGLEIHQQVAATKLFCRCPADAPPPDDSAPDFRFLRRLRPTQSELGEVDAAALAESRRDKWHEYLGAHDSSCLVDADEEPPHAASDDALDVALTFALLVDAAPVDEIQWMRKIVIDGSNTTGFQRTGLVARGGRIDDVGVQTICLEEDSCRRIRDEADRVLWGLDRLGIPLIEVATEPTIQDGDHARRMRATGRVKRGLGTIRQDLNVSVLDGQRVEVKGVQDLASIPRVIEWETRRHLRMIEVARQLRERSVTTADFAYRPVDVSDVFRATAAKFVQATLAKGGRVLGHRLPGLGGLLGAERKEEPRLGRELAAYARRDGGVQGILHGDELPGMGVTPTEVDAVKDALNCARHDSFVLVAHNPATADRALRVAVARAARALDGVLPEVRMAEADASTTYLRPMPGSARMYPETDVPPSNVAPQRLSHLRDSLPPPPEVLTARLQEVHALSQDAAQQLVREGAVAEFEALASEGDAALASRVLLQILPDLERRFPDAADRLLAWSREALRAVRAGAFAKEGLPQVLEALASGEAQDVASGAAARGLAGADLADVEARARTLVNERADFVRARGLESVGPLMGILMKEFRGRVDGKKLNAVLALEVERLLAAAAPKP